MSNFIPVMEIVNGKSNNKTIDSPKDAKEKLQKLKIKQAKLRVEEKRKNDLKQTRRFESNSIYDSLNSQMSTFNSSSNRLNLNRTSNKFIQSKKANELNTSFSGVDTKLSITFKGGTTVYVGEVQTVTYSTFRPIEPVYSLGDAKPSGYVRGQRTIAGSIIFTVFDRNVLLNAFYNAYSKDSDNSCVDQEYLTDELPPFNMHLTFMNEYGVSAALVIYDVYVTTEGQVHSIEDMITENTMQYVARDMTLMKPGDIT